MSTERARHRFSTDQYAKMAEAGVFDANDRVELIHGEIVEMPRMKPPHASVVTRLATRLIKRLPDDVIVRVQCDVRLGRWSQPAPDVLVARPDPDDYADKHPEAKDTLLAVEVADSSLTYDRKVKMPLYACEGIREYWLVDVNKQLVEVYLSPGPRGYAEVTRRKLGDRIAPLAFPELELTVAELVG